MRGGKPKPAQRLINEGAGARRGVHKLDRMAEAENCGYESGLPPCPARLTGDAKLAYEHYSAELTSAGLDKRVDALALERACVAWATIQKADRALRRGGEVVRVPILVGTSNARRIVGYRQVKNKWVSIRLEAEKMFKSFASEFGLAGPSTRVRLGVAEMSQREHSAELWERLRAPRPDRRPLPPELQAMVDSKPSDDPVKPS